MLDDFSFTLVGYVSSLKDSHPPKKNAAPALATRSPSQVLTDILKESEVWIFVCVCVCVFFLRDFLLFCWENSTLGFQTPNVRRYLDTKNIPKTPNLRRYLEDYIFCWKICFCGIFAWIFVIFIRKDEDMLKNYRKKRSRWFLWTWYEIVIEDMKDLLSWVSELLLVNTGVFIDMTVSK